MSEFLGVALTFRALMKNNIGNQLVVARDGAEVVAIHNYILSYIVMCRQPPAAPRPPPARRDTLK